MGLREFAAFAADDPPFAARVLKTANGACYGLREPCASLPQALALLGPQVLRNLVQHTAPMAEPERIIAAGFDLEGLWRHSILAAQVAEYLARRCRCPAHPKPDEAYSCGLLHDLGQIVMLDVLREPWLAAFEVAQGTGQPLYAAERERLGFDHTEVGLKVAAAWNLPVSVRQAMQHHHAPAANLVREPTAALMVGIDALTRAVAESGLADPEACFPAAARAALGLELPEAEAAIEFAQQALGLIVI